MAAVTITDAAVPCPAGVTTVAAVKVTRVGGNVQNQSHVTSLMVRMGADPTSALGRLLRPGEGVDFGALVNGERNGTNNVQADVRIFNPSTKPVQCYVIQGEIP